MGANKVLLQGHFFTVTKVLRSLSINENQTLLQEK